MTLLWWRHNEDTLDLRCQLSVYKECTLCTTLQRTTTWMSKFITLHCSRECPGLKFLWFHTRIIYDFILSILDFLVRSLYETKEIIYDPCMITKKAYMILVRSTVWYPGYHTVKREFLDCWWNLFQMGPAGPYTITVSLMNLISFHQNQMFFNFSLIFFRFSAQLTTGTSWKKAWLEIKISTKSVHYCCSTSITNFVWGSFPFFETWDSSKCSIFLETLCLKFFT